MDSRTLSLSKVLTNEVRYTVPLFQRKYVWTEVDNWWPLWTNIVETSCRLMTDQAQGATSTRPHFLGAVVHEGLIAKTGHIPEQRIIDGQQRMTTFQLILAATRAVADERGFVDQAARIGRLVRNPDDAIREPHHQYKVWPTNADRAAFELAMHDQPDDSLIGHAYKFFKRQIAAFIDMADGGPGPNPSDEEDWGGPSVSEAAEAAEPLPRLDALIDTMRDLVRIVVIELNPAEDDAQGIFETLNAHGTELLPSDLVKNHLFNRAQIAGLPVETLHTQYWTPLEDRWYSEADIIGRKPRQRLNLAIGYWAAISSRRSTDVGPSNLFSVVREIASDRSGPLTNQRPEQLTALFAEIAHHVQTWKRLRLATYATPEGRFMSRLRDLQTTTPIPLALWLAAQGDKIPTIQFHRALTAIESYLVRRAACGLPAKNYNRSFATVLAQARQAESGVVGDRVVELLHDFTGDSSRWPEDAEFKNALQEVGQYRGPLRSTRVRMVLEALESAMLGSDVEQLAPPGHGPSADDAPAGSGRTRKNRKFTIDHIMPQSWKEHWPFRPELSAEDHGKETALRNGSLDRLGNLTLVTGEKNAEMSNSGWATKRSYLQKRSMLVLTQATVLAFPQPPGTRRRHDEAARKADEDFANLWAIDPALAIAHRGTVLAQWAVHVWPRG